MNPLTHYKVSGQHEGRDRSAAFGTAKHLAACPDVRQAGINTLLHSIAYGQAKGRPIFPA